MDSAFSLDRSDSGPLAPASAQSARKRVADDVAMLRTAAELTRDINVARPMIYWGDFLGSAALGYAGLAGAILLSGVWAVVAAFVAMLVYFLRSGRSVQASAWMRILLVGFVMAAIAAVLYPGELTALANMLGVGRGADLLLYATVAALVFSLLVIYAKFKDAEVKIAQLARHIAILESLDESTADTLQPILADDVADPVTGA